MQSPSYHGYDTTDYYTVNQDYGTNEDFKRLIEEAHKRGIEVIVELVLNHTSSEHPWFVESASDPASAMHHLPGSGAETQDGETALVIMNFAAKGEQTGCTFSYGGDAIPAGVYRPGDLLTGEQVAELTVDANGFQGYAPVQSLAHRAGYVLLLDRSGG